MTHRAQTICTTLTAGIAALTLWAGMAAPVAADWRSDRASTSSYVPVGEPVVQTPQRSDVAPSEGSRTVIITDGPVIILPGHAQPPQAPVRPTLVYLPLSCIETVPVNRGEVRLMPARCLEDAGVDVRALPNRCGVTVRSRGEVLRGFDPGCLGDAGYRLARR